MYKYIFTGTVYPTRVNFTLSGLSSRYKDFSISSPDWGIEGSFDIEVKDCAVTVAFETEKIFNQKSEPNIETLKNLIEKTARLFVDTYCFIHSYNYDLTIDTVKCEKINLDHTFSVVGEFGFTGASDNFVKVLDIVLMKQPNAFGEAFADYRRAIKYPDITAAHCLRAIESIRRAHFDNQEIEEGNDRDKDGWRKMSKEIGVSPDGSYELMQKFAKPNRHGVYPAITWKQREEIMKFTRKVINGSLNWLTKKELL